MTIDPQLIGMAGGFLTTVAVVPQLLKTIRTRHARDLSFWQLVILMSGMLLWLTYGVAIGDPPLIIANAFSLLCYLLLLLLKLRFDRDLKEEGDDRVSTGGER